MKESDFWGLKPMPAPPINERPTCPYCGKPRKILIERDRIPVRGPGERYQGHELGYQVQQDTLVGFKYGPATGWRYAYPLSGHFCSLRCANYFANKIIDNLNDKKK